MKEKLFWPLIAISVIAALIVVFMVFGSEDENEIATRFIPGYNAAGTAGGATQVDTAPPNVAAASSVTVNGQPLTDETLVMLTGGQGTVPPGHYWYDTRSGLWGVMGGPTRGQIQPGLRIGEQLPANASGGGPGSSSMGVKFTRLKYNMSFKSWARQFPAVTGSTRI